MASDLSFNITALDNASKTFVKLAEQVERMSAKLDRLDGKDVNVDVNANTKAASANLTRFRTQLLGTTAISKVLNATLLTTAASLPILATATASAAYIVGGLSSSLAVAGAGLGAFGLAAAGNISKVTEVRDKVAALNEQLKNTTGAEARAAIIRQRTELLNSLTPAQDRLRTAIDAAATAYDAFLTKTSKPVSKALVAWIELAKPALKLLTPIVGAVSDALVVLAERAQRALKSPFWKSFAELIATNVGPILLHFGQIIGNVFTAIAGIIRAFLPAGQGFLGWLIGATEKFAQWGKTLDENRQFQRFVGYVKTNGPLLLSVLKGFGEFLGFIGKGLLLLGPPMLKVIRWLTRVGTEIFQAVLPSLKELWRQINKDFIPAFQNFWRAIEPLRDILRDVFVATLKSVVEIAKGLLKILGGVFQVVTGLIKGDWEKVWQGVQDIFFGTLQTVWNAAKVLLVGKIKAVFVGFGRLIGKLWGKLWNWAKGKFDDVVGKILGAAKGLRDKFLRVLGNLRDKIFDWAKGAWKWLIDAGKNIIGGLLRGIGNAMRGIRDWLRKNVWEPIKSAVLGLFGINSPSTEFQWMGKQMILGLIKGLSDTSWGSMIGTVFGGVSDLATKALGWLVDKGGVALSKLKGVASSVWESISGLFGGGGGGGELNEWIAKAMGITGVPASWAGPLRALAMHESGGNPRAFNDWDSNAAAGIPSQGLFQTIPPTFNAYKLFGSIMDPIANAVAAIRYIKATYGSIFDIPSYRGGNRFVGGYARGTTHAAPGMAWVGENGPELLKFAGGEQVVPNHALSTVGGQQPLIGGDLNIYGAKGDSEQELLSAAMFEVRRVRAGGVYA